MQRTQDEIFAMESIRQELLTDMKAARETIDNFDRILASHPSAIRKIGTGGKVNLSNGRIVEEEENANSRKNVPTPQVGFGKRMWSKAGIYAKKD